MALAKPPTLIPEVEAVDRLIEIAEAYCKLFGRSPANLSHWDPAEHSSRFRRHLRVPQLREPVAYRFPFQLNAREHLLTRLGYSHPSRRVLVTENGTSAVLAAANSLALLGVTSVKVVAASYFASRYALWRCGIDVGQEHWIRGPTGFTLPPLPLSPGEAVWLESPIFNTGVKIGEREVLRLAELAENGHFIVVDEVLSGGSSAPSAALQSSSRFIAVHAPHKSICVNGLKFGAVCFDRIYYDVFDQWSDVLNGALSLSAEAAVDHFLSPDFDGYRRVVEEECRDGETWLLQQLRSHGGNFVTDAGATGYWRTVYAPGIPAAQGDDWDWISSIVEESGATFIPGTRSAFDPAWGFNFRVNLLRLGPIERAALRRLLKVLRVHRFPQQPH
jgi:aspartate/methionine/tyrosine aminotransferase